MSSKKSKFQRKLTPQNFSSFKQSQQTAGLDCRAFFIGWKMKHLSNYFFNLDFLSEFCFRKHFTFTCSDGRKCRIEWVMGVHSSKQATVVLSEVLVCVKTILEYSLLLLCKEERSGGTVDWPPKLPTTNLVGLFMLLDTLKRNFPFMQWNFSQPTLIHNRCLVGSTNQAFSSGFYFRIVWKSTKRPSFLWNFCGASEVQT